MADISELIEAAKAEDGAQQFGELLHKHMEAAAVPLQATIKAKEESISKLEAKVAKIFDETKPIRHLMTERKLTIDTLGEQLDKAAGQPDVKSVKDLRAMALDLAGPMVADQVAAATVKMREDLTKVEGERDGYRTLNESMATARDEALYDRDFVAATTGKGRPVPLQFTADQLKTGLRPYVHYEDVELPGGQMVRQAVIRDGSTPIFGDDAKPTDFAGLIDKAHAGRGNGRYDTGTRQFFESGGTGGGASANGGSSAFGGAQKLTPESARAATTLAEYEKLKEA